MPETKINDTVKIPVVAASAAASSHRVLAERILSQAKPVATSPRPAIR